MSTYEVEAVPAWKLALWRGWIARTSWEATR